MVWGQAEERNLRTGDFCVNHCLNDHGNVRNMAIHSVNFPIFNCLGCSTYFIKPENLLTKSYLHEAQQALIFWITSFCFTWRTVLCIPAKEYCAESSAKPEDLTAKLIEATGGYGDFKLHVKLHTISIGKSFDLFFNNHEHIFWNIYSENVVLSYFIQAE